MTNSRDKGKNGEREACKILSNVFGGSFTRVPSSGALVGGKNIVRLDTLSETQGRAFRGDIIPPDFLPKMFLEVKAYKEFRFHQLIQPSSCPLLDVWIKQAIIGKQDDDQWFVCFKINLKGWYVAVPEDEYEGYTFDNYSVYNSPHGKVRVTDMLSFFKANKDLISKKAGPSSVDDNSDDDRIKNHDSTKTDFKNAPKLSASGGSHRGNAETNDSLSQE